MADYKVVDTEQLEADLMSVANAIREKTGGTETLAFPGDFISGQEIVFQAGEKSEHDRFWDAYQNNGSRRDYSQAFASWPSDDLLRPKHDISVSNAYMMFMYYQGATDLVQRAQECGIGIDFSGCSNFTYAFAYCQLQHLGVVDTRSCSGSFQYFGEGSWSLATIDELILREDGSQAFSAAGTFLPPGLVNVKVTGKFGSSIQCSKCTMLSKDSITSIINALLETASGQTLTLYAGNVMTAFETAPGANDGDTSAQWLALVNTRPNWTISLVW